MSEVQGFDGINKQLQAKIAELRMPAAVVVGFSVNYAIFVHENLTAHHPVGQAKFLETAARENEDRINKIVANALKKGLTLEQALLLGGLYLQREAQKLCPVDTGALKNSAYTRVDK